MKIAIIEYNAGNVQSVVYALNRLGYEPIITSDHEEIKSADKVIFPGVGEASSAMKHLQERDLDILLPTLTQPVLGVCIGQQLMCNHSEEGDTMCLGIFPIEVKHFPKDKGEKVPHMGWNTIGFGDNVLFTGLKPESYVYYVHSYYCEDSDFTVANTKYVVPYSAALQKDNFYAVQFHPEKSGDIGAQIIKNFIELI